MNLMLKRKIYISSWLLILLLITPFHATASAIEATSPGVNVLGLPTPEITKLEADNSIVYLKANGFINKNASLVAIVSLADENGNIIDVAEKKVSDPENIRISFRTDKIRAGDIIEAKFTNYGIEGDGADHTHDVPPAPPAPPVEDGGEVEIPPEPAPPATTDPSPPEVIRETVYVNNSKSGKTKYVVRDGPEASPETVVVEKIVEVEVPVDAENAMVNAPNTPSFSDINNGVLGNGNNSSSTTRSAGKGVITIINDPVTPNKFDETLNAFGYDGSIVDPYGRFSKTFLCLLWILLIIIIILLILNYLKHKRNLKDEDSLSPNNEVNKTTPSTMKTNSNAKARSIHIDLSRIFLGVKIFSLASKKVIEDRRRIAEQKKETAKKEEKQLKYTTKELSDIFDTYGAMYDQDPNALPVDIFSVINTYKRAYEAYKCDNSMSNAENLSTRNQHN